MTRNVIRKRVELNSDDVRWFYEHYPQGSLPGVLSMLFTKFREVNQVTPGEYARLAAEAFSSLREASNGREENKTQE